MLVSIVIPALPGEAALGALLPQLPPQRDVEIIVSLGGAPDAQTNALRLARPDVLWLESASGRGPQLNTGAAHATGTWLWFVHADSRVPDAWLDVFRALSADDLIGGSFAFRLDSDAWQARVIERLVAWRVRWFALPYGDQGIFVRRSVFEELGGYAAVPLMEDVELVGRLNRRGRLQHLRAGLVTSARRWQRDGWWARSATNLTFLALYRLGVSTDWLATRYYRHHGD